MIARHPRYRATHGLPQKDYCQLKEIILRNFVRAPMEVIPNQGYGEFTARFWTLSSPEFDFLIPLCYRPDPITGKLKKTVTPEWVAHLTWEAVAWWFMDDGCRQENSLMIATHSFSKEEVDLLAVWLTANGCPAHAHKTRKGKTKTYYVLKIPTESAGKFKTQVDPFILPMMRYKLETAGPRGTELSCTFCGGAFRGNGRHLGGQGKFPCCQNRKCRKEASAASSARCAENLGGQKVRYQKERARLEQKTEEERESLRQHINARQNARSANMTPAAKAAFLKRKRERRAAAKRAENGK
jgi:hypothetical protein